MNITNIKINIYIYGGFALSGDDPSAGVYFRVWAALVRKGAGQDVRDDMGAVQRSSLSLLFRTEALQKRRARAGPFDWRGAGGGGWGISIVYAGLGRRGPPPLMFPYSHFRQKRW